MSDLIYQSARTLAEMIRCRDISAREAVEAHLDRADEVNDRINALTERLDEEALAAADAADDALARGISLGPLHGVPITLKECLGMAGKPTTCGSPIMKDYIPDEDATAVARMRAAGAIPIARTNLPEWALDYQSDNTMFGRTLNPWNPDVTSGGSSGGEGAAIAAGISPLGLGSDLGGSVRIPSHFCGVCGIKPTSGRVPVTGHVAPGMYGWNHIGPLARDIDDLGLALHCISGPDGHDPAAEPVPLSGARFHSLKGMRVGYMLGDGVVPFSKETQASVECAVALAEELGADVQEAMLPHLETIFPVVNTLYALDFIELYETIWKRDEENLHPQLKDLVALLDPSLAITDVSQAVMQQRRLKQGAMQYFERYDLLICPVTSVPAVPHGVRQTNVVDGEEVPYFMIATLLFLWNLTGNPSLVIPVRVGPEGLPYGVQIVARHWDEGTQFMAGKALLDAVGGCPRPPGY